MAGISKEKVMTAVERTCETFEELHLTMEERAIVAYSTYAVAKRFETFEELEKQKEVEEKPQKTSKFQIYAAVCSTSAIIISVIAIILGLLK